MLSINGAICAIFIAVSLRYRARANRPYAFKRLQWQSVDLVGTLLCRCAGLSGGPRTTAAQAVDLGFDQPAVDAVGAQQSLRRAVLHEAALLQHQDAVEVAHGG